MTSSPRAVAATARLDRFVDDACRLAGLPPGADLVRHFANAVYRLRDAPVVARVGYGPGIAERAARAVGTTRWLAGLDFPATVPADLPSGADQPLVLGDEGRPVVVTFWRYYPQPLDRPWPDTEILARLARDLHGLDVAPPVRLPDYEPLRTLTAVLRTSTARTVLGDTDHGWLAGRVDTLRTAFAALDFPLGRGLVHADLYTGNLLWSLDGRHPVVLGDWDSVCLGPREIDLIPTWHEPRFGVDPGTVGRFARAYGYDLTGWDGYPTLYDIRELSTLSALIRLAPTNTTSRAELAHRLDTLRRGDRDGRWHGQ